MPTATTTTTKEPNTIELSTLPPESPAQEPPTIDPPPDAYLTTTIPDGGYGWTVVLCASMTAFLQNGILNCWGVLQAALLSSTLSSTPPSTVSFIGSLGLAGGAAYGLIAVRFMRYFGSRAASILGVLIMALSLIGSAECTGNVGGLFGTNGVLGGVGMALVYAVCNALPVQYFSGHLGFANGLVKLGGGIGGCVMAVALEALNAKVGIAWTFRVQGFLTIAVGLPAAWFLRDRVPLRGVPFVDLHMFKSGVFAAVFAAGAVGTFALFVPPYFLPLFAQSVGMSSGTGAGLVAAFNACNAVGRFVAGPLCDKIGPVNMLMITTLLNAVSMLAIWPVYPGTAVFFAISNGIANGSFFTTMPTVVAGLFGPGRAAVAMSLAITGWTGGYLLGAPIAGLLLEASGGKTTEAKQGIEVYRPAILYAGGVAMASFLFVLIARLKLEKKVTKKV